MRIFLIIILLSSINLQAQVKDSIFVDELKKYCQVLDSRTESGQIYNIVINYDGQSLKYGKWKFYYDNGNIKSEGYMWFKSFVRCATGPGPHKAHHSQKRIGQWEYWQKNGKKRTDLSHDEIAYTGNYRCFDHKGNLTQEGYFEKGKLINGKTYSYFTSPNYATSIDVIKNGKLVNKEWK